MAEEKKPSAPKPAASLAQDPELITEFISEAGEHVVSIENNLLLLEQDASNTAALQAVFGASTRSRDWPAFWNCPCSNSWRTKSKACSIWRATALWLSIRAWSMSFWRAWIISSGPSEGSKPFSRRESPLPNRPSVRLRI